MCEGGLEVAIRTQISTCSFFLGKWFSKCSQLQLQIPYFNLLNWGIMFKTFRGATEPSQPDLLLWTRPPSEPLPPDLILTRFWPGLTRVGPERRISGPNRVKIGSELGLGGGVRRGGRLCSSSGKSWGTKSYFIQFALVWFRNVARSRPYAATAFPKNLFGLFLTFCLARQK